MPAKGQIADLENHRALLAEKVANYTRLLEEVQKKHDAIVIALEVIGQSKPASAWRGKPDLDIDPDALAGKPLKAAVLFIAEQSGGVMHVSPARRLLVKAGILREGQYGSNRINSAIRELNRFKRVGRGKYLLTASHADDESNDNG